MQQSTFPRRFHYVHHSLFQPNTYLRVFGTIASKLQLLRTAALIDRQRLSGAAQPDPQWVRETHAYSLLWYWQKTAIYRDIVHHLVKPRFAYNYIDQFSEHGFRYTSTPVNVFVCESDQTFLFLLNYMESELGPQANTLEKEDYRHVLFVNHKDVMTQSYHVSDKSGPASFYYVSTECQNIEEWKKVSLRHGVHFSDFFYSLWNREIQEAMTADIQRKRALAQDIAERKRGYLRRAAGPDELMRFLQEQQQLRKKHVDSQPAAFVFMTTLAFIQWIDADPEFENREPYSLNLINDGSFHVFDTHNAMSDVENLGDKLRSTISKQFKTVNVWSCTAFMYMSMIFRFQHALFFQRYLSLSMFLLLLSIRERTDVWFFSVDYMIGDAFFPIKETEEEARLKSSDLLISSFRISMSEWQRRRAERDFQCLTRCIANESSRSAKKQAYPPTYYQTHLRPAYRKMIKNLTKHDKATKFLVTDFVKSLSVTDESSIFVPIYLNMLMRLRWKSQPSAELLELLTMEGYNSLNGFTVERRFDLMLEEFWNRDEELYPCASVPGSLTQEQEQVARDSIKYWTTYRLQSFLSHPMYRRVQDRHLLDPSLSLSEIFASIRHVDSLAGSQVYRDMDLVHLKTLMHQRMDNFIYTEAKKTLETSIQGKQYSGPAYSMAVGAVQNQTGKLRSMEPDDALLNPDFPPEEFMQFCACVQPNCSTLFTESLQSALAKIGPANNRSRHGEEEEEIVCDTDDPLLIPRIIKNSERLSDCQESDRRFTDVLRLLKYADEEFRRVMQLRLGEFCQVADRPTAPSSFPFAVIRAVHLPSPMKVESLLDYWGPQGRTLVLCSDDLEAAFFSAKQRMPSASMYTFSLFQMVLDTEDQEDVSRFAQQFDRLVFVSTCLSEEESKTQSPFWQPHEHCTGCGLCQLKGLAPRRGLQFRSAEDCMVENEKSLRFFHRFFHAGDTNRHVWIYQPFVDGRVSESQKLWRLPAYGNFEMDWLLSVSSSRGADDLVLKLLWACRVPREKCAFYAHFPSSKFADVHEREHLEAEAIIVEKQQQCRKDAMQGAPIYHNRDGEKRESEEEEEDEKRVASYQFVEVLINEYQRMSMDNGKRAEDLFACTLAFRPPYFH